MCGCVYLWLRVSWSLVSMCGCVLVTHCLVCVGVFSCGSEYHGLQFHFVSVCVDQPRAASRQFIWRQWWLNQLSNMRDSVWSYPLVYLTHWVLLAQAIHLSIWRTGCTWHKQFTRLFDALGALGTSNSLVYLTHWVLLVRLWLEEWRWQSCFNSQPVQRIMHHDSSSGQVQRLIHHDSSSGQVQRIIHHCHNWYLKHKEPNVISNNCFPHVVKVSIHDPNPMIRVGQNHAYICIYSEYTVFLAGNLPYIRSCTVHTYGSGQP